MKIIKVVTDQGDSYTFATEKRDNKDLMKAEGAEFEVEYLGAGWREGEHLVKVNGEVHTVSIINGHLVIDNETLFKVDRVIEESLGEKVSFEELFKGKEGEIVSPLQGRIVQIRVKEGDAVNKGQPLLSIEAMKSETVISAPKGGVVKKVLIKPGQGVKKGDLLLIIE
ncbi:biotin/lipoyl-containing protein [Sulfolobus acidocaldarius]|uniref:Conserved protein n=4 Tax=Sulfolobus acidocaldarius TaxID=2285 RepID=Q4JC02_SULAC|nr:biotin/lipoyl-containing protein [Sulfolobus acidocaldarius]AAY79677.1 conserved protein [Sulfolobus acidocaldarius DSM 639]AGE70235.1 hypothetical protein SacN8_01270 [Sulfolobus acidocaldarius N8]AGE72510.1 hypothetical protein SacRon12I_01270 [Sulfolobus acidocaldarius Ron12/I]ALU29359.1 acetyl-CoA carboxylase biotin carboxyl carrier protein subunit [Sulfolobus acidocaldarius]ALU32088.1 acetyl-CoA carboxylase biotin carboxyl carrier protein subunit [Sulfolobus acidocaldarius]